jgi:hypothetical protein
MSARLSAVAVVVILVGCHSASQGHLGKRSEVWCGQSLTKPGFIASYGMRALEPIESPVAAAPRSSVLPPHVDSDSPELLGWSDLLILSKDCGVGLVVTVSQSPYVRTVGVAYDRDHRGLTALLLGHIKAAGSTKQMSIRVVAYRGPTPAGRATLIF